MKTNQVAAALALMFSWCTAGAAGEEHFFANEIAGEYTRVHLSVSKDGKVHGSKVWQPAVGHGAEGTLEGVADGELLRVLYAYEIEGSAQSEEMIFRMAGDKLLVGQGPLVDLGDGRMKLKEPDKVVFGEPLKRLPVGEFAPGSAERKAVMDAMRGPISKFAGEPVEFTGKLRSVDGWVRFSGKVKTADGSPPEDEKVAANMEMDCLAFLKKDADGNWKVMHWGFAGDTLVMDTAKEKLDDAPWPLFVW